MRIDYVDFLSLTELEYALSLNNGPNAPCAEDRALIEARYNAALPNDKILTLRADKGQILSLNQEDIAELEKRIRTNPHYETLNLIGVETFGDMSGVLGAIKDHPSIRHLNFSGSRFIDESFHKSFYETRRAKSFVSLNLDQMMLCIASDKSFVEDHKKDFDPQLLLEKEKQCERAKKWQHLTSGYYRIDNDDYGFSPTLCSLTVSMQTWRNYVVEGKDLIGLLGDVYDHMPNLVDLTLTLEQNPSVLDYVASVNTQREEYLTGLRSAILIYAKTDDPKKLENYNLPEIQTRVPSLLYVAEKYGRREDLVAALPKFYAYASERWDKEKWASYINSNEFYLCHLTKAERERLMQAAGEIRTVPVVTPLALVDQAPLIPDAPPPDLDEVIASIPVYTDEEISAMLDECERDPAKIALFANDLVLKRNDIMMADMHAQRYPAASQETIQGFIDFSREMATTEKMAQTYIDPLLPSVPKNGASDKALPIVAVEVEPPKKLWHTVMRTITGLFAGTKTLDENAQRLQDLQNGHLAAGRACEHLTKVIPGIQGLQADCAYVAACKDKVGEAYEKLSTQVGRCMEQAATRVKEWTQQDDDNPSYDLMGERKIPPRITDMTNRIQVLTKTQLTLATDYAESRMVSDAQKDMAHTYGGLNTEVIPNLIKSASTARDSIKMCRDAWTLDAIVKAANIQNGNGTNRLVAVAMQVQASIQMIKENAAFATGVLFDGPEIPAVGVTPAIAALDVKP